MYKRYGYSFKYDSRGADHSIDIRMVIGFIGLFVVFPLFGIASYFDTQVIENPFQVTFGQISLLILMLTFVSCSLLAYVANDFPVFGYTAISLITFVGYTVALLVFPVSYAISRNGVLICYAILIVTYEILILDAAFQLINRAKAANQSRNSDA